MSEQVINNKIINHDIKTLTRFKKRLIYAELSINLWWVRRTKHMLKHLRKSRKKSK